MATPRWFSALSDALNKSPKTVIYSLATVDASVSPPIPRVRSIVHREFISPTPDSPLLVSTTDVRTPKICQLASIQPQPLPPGVSSNAEVVWWFPGDDLNEQYRFSGKIHVLPRTDHELFKSFPRERLAPAHDENGKEFDWEAERIRVFDEKMGGVLRASFARPTPGSPLEKYEDAEKWPAKLPKTTEVDDETKPHVEFALQNFSLMVLEPVAVERVELAVMPNRRTQWERAGKEWKEKIVVP
ncbi:hypothetical protein FRB90_003943 [Tulasnella sp. 427]|nr:hypothetical protein FRB90_003943 [Tulasnella sp. 427]